MLDEAAKADFSFKAFFVPLTTLKAIHIIVIIAFIVFGNMLFNGFVWDDKIYITHNAEMKSLTLFQYFAENAFNSIGQYRPIPAIYFSSLYKLFAETPFFYHFLQLIFHIVNAILIFLLLNKFFAKHISLFLSLIFLIHPIQVESVSFIAATISPLFFFFGIIAILISDTSRLSILRLTSICLLILASLLTKETGVLFVLLILLYKIVFFKKVHIPLFVSTICAILIYFTIRFGAGGIYFQSLQTIPINTLSIQERLMHVPTIIFYYLKTLAFPVTLVHNQLWVITEYTFQNLYFPLLIAILALISVYLLSQYARKVSTKLFRAYIFFFIWFLTGLGLHLNIFPLDQTVADRWFYFPIVGLLGMSGVGLELLTYNRRRLAKVTYVVLIIIISMYSIRTMTRNTNWVDAITLYKHDMKIAYNFDIETNLATEYLLAHRYDEALAHFKHVTDIVENEITLYNLAATYEQMGNGQMALRYYRKAINDNKLQDSHNHNLTTYTGVSRALLNIGSYKEANVILKQGIVEYPDDVTLWKYLAIDLYKLNKNEQAMDAANRAYRISPNEETSALITQIQSRTL